MERRASRIKGRDSMSLGGIQDQGHGFSPTDCDTTVPVEVRWERRMRAEWTHHKGQRMSTTLIAVCRERSGKPL